MPALHLEQLHLWPEVGVDVVRVLERRRRKGRVLAPSETARGSASYARRARAGTSSHLVVNDLLLEAIGSRRLDHQLHLA